METIFKRWWLLLLNGILFLILGVISLAYPVTALFSVAVYIGVVALVAGIGSIVVALSNMRVRSWGWRLLEGVIDVIFGLLMLGNPLLSAAMIPVLIGIWVFVRGLMYVADSLAWRRRGSGDWSRYLIVGILLLVLLPPLGIYLLWRRQRFDLKVRYGLSAGSAIWFVVLVVLLATVIFGGRGDTTTQGELVITTISPSPSATVDPDATETPAPSGSGLVAK